MRDASRPAGAPTECPHVVASGTTQDVVDGGELGPAQEFVQRCGRELIWRDPVAGEPPSCYCRQGHEFLEHDGHLVPDVDDDGQGDELQTVERDGETFLQAGRAGDALAGAPNPDAGADEVPPAWRETAAALAELRAHGDACLQALEVLAQANPDPEPQAPPIMLLAAARDLLERPLWRSAIVSAVLEAFDSEAQQRIAAGEYTASTMDRLQVTRGLRRVLGDDLIEVPADAR